MPLAMEVVEQVDHELVLACGLIELKHAFVLGYFLILVVEVVLDPVDSEKEQDKVYQVAGVVHELKGSSGLADEVKFLQHGKKNVVHFVRIGQ
jgi:hypothetical protein